MAYTQTSIQKQRSELRRMRNSIDATRRRIEALTRTESSARRTIAGIQKRQQQVSASMLALSLKLHMLQDSASVVDSTVRTMASELDRAETAYAGVARSMLRMETETRGTSGPSRERPRSAFRELSRQLAEYRQRTLHIKDSLEQQHDLLEEVSLTQQSVLATQSAQQQNLNQNYKQQQLALQGIRSNKAALAEELAKRKQSAARVGSLIATLEQQARKAAAAEQARRKASKAKGRRGGSATAEKDVPSAIVSGKGFGAKSLPWPTPGRSLVHGYGTYSNPGTGTVMENPGIDIKAPTGSRVASVATGTVSSVTWLPGFGSLVIVDHGNGFRTVYANLQASSVGRGARIQAGSTIGTSGESIDGQLVHFEVWEGRQRKNPLTYLR